MGTTFCETFKASNSTTSLLMSQPAAERDNPTQNKTNKLKTSTWGVHH
jgi:hypothetical protein